MCRSSPGTRATTAPHVRQTLGLPSRNATGVDVVRGLRRQESYLSTSRLPSRLRSDRHRRDWRRGHLGAAVRRASRPRITLYAAGLRYEDLVGAVDVVVTKPGYGIIAECVANGTAMLYTSRGHFVEYDALVREMPRFLRCEYIDHESLFAGRWRDALRRLLSSAPAPERPPTDGAQVVARMIAEGVVRSG